MLPRTIFLSKLIGLWVGDSDQRLDVVVPVAGSCVWDAYGIRTIARRLPDLRWVQGSGKRLGGRAKVHIPTIQTPHSQWWFWIAPFACSGRILEQK